MDLTAFGPYALNVRTNISSYGPRARVNKSIVLYCVVLETKTIFTLYVSDQMILQFHFSSTNFVQKRFKFSLYAISLKCK